MPGSPPADLDLRLAYAFTVLAEQRNFGRAAAEPRVLVVQRDHRLAGEESVTLDDIADEPLARLRSADPAFSARWRADPRPDGRPAPAGPVAETLADKFELVAAGHAAVISAGMYATGTRPDLTAIPVEGLEPAQVVLLTRAGERSPLVTAFRDCARAHLPAA